MRISFSQLNRQVQNVVQDRYYDLTQLQNQLATGKRLNRPSDAPVDVANDLKLRNKNAQLKQFKRNMEDAQGFMAVTDTAMISMNDLMQRLRELAIEAASDTYTVVERRYISKETEQLLRQVISLLNTNFKGDYIFAGTQSKIAPVPMQSSVARIPEDYSNLRMAYFDASVAGTDTPVQILNAFDNTPITNIIPNTFELTSNDSLGVRRTWVEGRDYTIDYVAGTITILSTGTDPAALTVDISEGGAFGTGPNGYYSQSGFSMKFDYATKGKDIYGNIVPMTGDIYREVETGIVVPVNITGDELMRNARTGTNVIESLVRLGQNLLYDNTAGIRDSIANIDAALENILSAESKNGARTNRFETTMSRNEEQFNEATRLQSELEDADLAETITNFSLAESVYNAALKSAARVIQPTLVDFL